MRRAGLTTADHSHRGWNGHVDGGGKAVDPVGVYRKPAAGVQEITSVIVDRGQLQSLHRAFVRGIEHALVLERQGGAGIFGDACRQGNADGGILGNALSGKRFIVGVGHLRQTQRIVKFESCHAQIVERRELHLRFRADLVGMGVQVRFDLVVIHA